MPLKWLIRIFIYLMFIYIGRPGYLSVLNVLQTVWPSWSHFFQKVEERQPTIMAHYLSFCCKDSVNGRSSHVDVFFKIEVLKCFAIYKGKYLHWSLFNKVAGFQCAMLSKKKLVQMYCCEFCKIFKTIFLGIPSFKYMTAFERALNFTKNGANSYHYCF